MLLDIMLNHIGPRFEPLRTAHKDILLSSSMPCSILLFVLVIEFIELAEGSWSEWESQLVPPPYIYLVMHDAAGRGPFTFGRGTLTFLFTSLFSGKFTPAVEGQTREPACERTAHPPNLNGPSPCPLCKGYMAQFFGWFNNMIHIPHIVARDQTWFRVGHWELQSISWTAMIPGVDRAVAVDVVAADAVLASHIQQVTLRSYLLLFQGRL